MTLATEQNGVEDPSGQTESPVLHEHASHLETWSANERMRHIPSVAWMVEKLDHDLRRRIDLLWDAASNAIAGDVEKEFRGLCRSLDRVAEVARRTRGNHQHPPPDLGGRVQLALNHAVANLNMMDAELFGRRYPFHTSERSYAEPLWGAMLAVIEHVHHLTDLVRPLDRGIDERMFEGLVTLQTPLDARPIA